MECNNLVLRLYKILNSLQDEESKIIFEARVAYLFTRNEGEYYKILEKVRKNSYCAELEDFLKDNQENQGIIIYGAEEEGVRTKKLLDSCGREATLFCDDSDKMIGGRVEGLEVVSLEQVISKYGEYVVILSRWSNLADMYSLLLRSGFPRKQILFPMYMHLVASNGIQYFDTLSPVKDEVFVDAGSYNGDTIREFIKWSKGEYKKIYAFEANDEMIPVVEKYLASEQVKNVMFINKATWDKEEEVNFVKDACASRVGEEGADRIPAIDIDSVVGDDKVTFIKMDVEGSELHSLAGAQNTIKRNKPRLAISVYHKPEDVVEIAEYILELVPEYRLMLRQYNSNFWETVLYAY